MDPSLILLSRYVSDRSEPAFREVVSRHAGMVYQTALRWTGGDAVKAQDVAQMVFTDLAWKAGQLPRTVVVAGWLYRHTGFVAAHLMRSERRRQQREHRAFLAGIGHAAAGQAMVSAGSGSDGWRGGFSAGGVGGGAGDSGFGGEWEEVVWQQILPVLDEAMERLAARDRDALVLRFLEGRALREVGELLGLSENTARMRVNRALEKLRRALDRRGIRDIRTAGALGVVLGLGAAAGRLEAMPTGLADALASAALTSSPVAGAAAATAAASGAGLTGGGASLPWWIKGMSVAVLGCGAVVAPIALMTPGTSSGSGALVTVEEPHSRLNSSPPSQKPESPVPAPDKEPLPPPVEPATAPAAPPAAAPAQTQPPDAAPNPAVSRPVAVARLKLGVVPAVMKFDSTLLTVKPGAQVMLLLQNAKCPLQHNLVLVKPGKLADIGALADAMLRDPAAITKNYIPTSPDIIAHSTKLIGIGQSDLIQFTAPTEPGDYPYLCTFPGHWRLMNGILRVAP